MAGSDPVVLVVEDEPDVAETYRLSLEDRYEVRVAHDGEAGLALLDDDVDVVLLDRMMPGLSGDAVLERTREEGVGCRVAMVTAVEPDFDILEMGFDTYLSKPVDGETLRGTVENLLERAAYDRLLREYYALVETRATLEATKHRSELEASDEYDRLKADIRELRADLSETLGGVEDDEDFVATIRALGDDA
jgi:DNA-binding response OmpR family regulator